LRRKFLINIVFLLLVSLIVKAFWVLGIDRTVQNIAGEEAYGFYFSLFSFSVLFTLVLDMGLSGFNNRAVSADPSRVRLYFGNVLLLRLALTAVYFAITLTVAWMLGYSTGQMSLLLVLMVNQFMASLKEEEKEKVIIYKLPFTGVASMLSGEPSANVEDNWVLFCRSYMIFAESPEILSLIAAFQSTLPPADIRYMLFRISCTKISVAPVL